MVGDKLRFRFRKAGDLRLLSHHDLMRCGERMLRRAAIPFKSTAGFHPTPRLVFALSLPLGVVGHREVFELELTEPRDAAEVRDRLNAQAPAGLELLSANVVPPKATAVPRRVVYRLPLPDDRQSAAADACADVMAREKIWADRTHPKPKQVNVAPYVRGLRVEGGAAVLDLWVTQSGTARSEEVLRLIGVKDLVNTFAPLERTELELHDETPADAPDGPPPEGPPESRPLTNLPADAVSDGQETATAAATWGLSPNGPAVE